MSSLSGRQKAILAWVTTGASNQEVAHRLKVGIKTIEGDLTKVLRTLRIQTRVEAAVIWTLLSVMTPEPAGSQPLEPR